MVRRFPKDTLDWPTLPVTTLVPDSTPPEPKTDSEEPQRLNQEKAKRADTGSLPTLPTGDGTRQRQLEVNAGADSDVNEPPPASRKTNPLPTPTLTTLQYFTYESLPDICLRTQYTCQSWKHSGNPTRMHGPVGTPQG